MIGQTISHYKILERLGEGGMGVVYKALDTHLDRLVALKFLPPHLGTDPDARARFIQEAKSASVLDHTNICTIHDIDETDDGRLFIAMSCYEGESLKDKIGRGPLPVEEAVDYAVQIAQGLSLAHEAGIIHRDIKPGNVMITARGEVKIVDFGLAKMAETTLTKTGRTLGTAMYMSPEQARGEKVDERADIWSLGVVLYEMLTGKQPFRADYEQAVIYLLMSTDPEPISSICPEVPGSLVSVVSKSTHKDPNDRYADMGAMLAELRSVQQTLTAVKKEEEKPEPSIAVLSFVDMSPQKDQEYFCDGMAEEIINALTKIRGLQVVARTSAFYFKGKDMDVREVGRMLDVETVLEGSVRKSGNRLRITAQFINVADGFHLWSERYDRVMEDVFEIQDEISLAIVEKLEVALGVLERGPLVKPPTDNLEAYDLYLRGRHLLEHQWDIRKALTLFNQAIELDPRFALAHVGIARAYNTLGFYGLVRPAEILPKAKAAVQQALEFDDKLSEAYSLWGWINYMYDWDWVNAERHLKRAITLDPSSAEAHWRYAHFLFWVCGQFDEAEDETRRSMELDPNNSLLLTLLGIFQTVAGRYSEAIATHLKSVELAPTSSIALHELGRAYQNNQMYSEAIATYEKEIALSGRHPWPVFELARCYSAVGKNEEAETFIGELFARSKNEYVQTSLLAVLLAIQGRIDEAFELLDQAYADRDGILYIIKYIPIFDTLRDDPRFDAFLKKMGFDK